MQFDSIMGLCGIVPRTFDAHPVEMPAHYSVGFNNWKQRGAIFLISGDDMLYPCHIILSKLTV